MLLAFPMIFFAYTEPANVNGTLEKLKARLGMVLGVGCRV